MKTVSNSTVPCWAQVGTLLLFVAVAAHAETFCSLRVAVAGYDGKPVQTEVSVSGLGAAPQIQFTDRNGTASFCDVPLGLFDVAVGPPMCGQVIVKHLSQSWPNQLVIRVVYGYCHSPVGTGGCTYLIRTMDETGAALAGIQLKSSQIEKASDDLGRIFVFVRSGQSLAGTLKNDKYWPANINLTCRGSDSEHSVQLRRR